MLASEYYEKTNDWSVSTSVRRMSMLENVGPSNEITDVIHILGYEDRKGATRLLNKAVQSGVKFSGEDLVDIWDICDKESVNKAMHFSADIFTTRDLEDLSLCIDDEQVIKIANQYKINVPKDIYDEYEEILCQDTTTPVSWSRFYEVYCEWSKEYAVKRLKSLTEYGDEDEVMNVVQELFRGDIHGASEFIRRALTFGVKFTTFYLIELSYLCDEATVESAVLNSSILFNQNDLEALYGNIEDRIIKAAAKKNHLKLPEGMQEDSGDYTEESGEVMYQSSNAGGFWRRLFGRKSKESTFSEEECFLYGIHPDDEMYRKTMELDILSKNYKK